MTEEETHLLIATLRRELEEAVAKAATLSKTLDRQGDAATNRAGYLSSRAIAAEKERDEAAASSGAFKEQAQNALDELSATKARAARLETVSVAAQRVLDEKFSTFKARNGRDVGVQGDDGEKCWIVHCDPMFGLETALAALPKEAETVGERTWDGVERRKQTHYHPEDGLAWRPGDTRLRTWDWLPDRRKPPAQPEGDRP